MPTYEYRCPKGHRFDLFQKMSDPPTAKCPECGKAAERQIVPGAGFLFKGEGFYITDYRSDDYKKKAAGEEPKSVASPGKSESGPKGGESSAAESKPEKSEKSGQGEASKSAKKESKRQGKRSSGGDE
jgi:putative FmdB family regulatory protein